MESERVCIAGSASYIHEAIAFKDCRWEDGRFDFNEGFNYWHPDSFLPVIHPLYQDHKHKEYPIMLTRIAFKDKIYYV